MSVCALLGAAGGDILQLVIGFIGALTVAPLALIFPAYIHMCVVEPASMARQVINVLLIAFGFFVFFLSTNVAVQNIVAKFLE